MEVGMEMEDDVFFADLNKQISLLIMDDDDDDPVARCPSASLQAFSRAVHYPAAPPSFSHNIQQTNCWKESKGTGVFIPQSSSHSRRKNNNRSQGKFSSSSHRQSAENNHSRSSAGFPPQTSSNNNYYMNNKNTSHNSLFNPKRC